VEATRPGKVNVIQTAAVATHASTRKAPLCDRRRGGMSLDEVERVVI
jgi:hypothetical protein